MWLKNTLMKILSQRKNLGFEGWSFGAVLRLPITFPRLAKVAILITKADA
jgi:hypothetical protein